MSKLIIIIGSIVFAVAMYSIPILLACSICLHWDGMYKFLLSVCAVLQVIFICFAIMDKVEDET